MRHLTRILCLAFGLLGFVAAPGASAQDWPSKPIRLLVGFGAGGGTDVTARLFAQRLSTQLGQPVVVENRTGASGAIAAEHVAKAEPDGYRLLMIASGTFINSVLATKPPYDVLRDFTPISFVTMAPLVLVAGPGTSASTVDALIEQARAKPGAITFSSDGIGATAHLAAELFGLMTNSKLLHVPYKGAADATAAVASGQVNIGFPSVTAAISMLQAGKVRALAVTSRQRSSLLPQVPTLDELGLRGYEVVGWFGLIGPPGLPATVVDKLNTALAAVAKEADTKDAVGKQGLEVKLGTPEQFAAYMREQAEMISKLGKEANIKID